MKRMMTLLLSALILLALALPCAAEQNGFVRLDSELSEDGTAYLRALFDHVLKTYGIEAYFLINYDYKGGDPFKAYVKGYLNQQNSSSDALAFAVSSSTYYMNTRGRASDLLQDGDMDKLYEAIRAADEAGDQYLTAVKFYTALNELLSERVKTAPATDAAPDAAASTEPAERIVVPGSVEIPDEISPTRGDRLVDQADLLGPEEESALRQKLDQISEALQFDVVIVTAQHIGTRTPMEFADDYFDYNGFGYGKNYDGVCLLISMAERDWWISTCGFGETALSDDYFMHFISPSDFTYYLKNGNYDKSFNYFADVVNDFVLEAKAGEPFSSKHRYQDWKNKVIGVCVSLAIGLIAAAIVTYYKKENYVGAVQQKREAGCYMVGSVRFGECYDNFLYSSVNKSRRVTESSSSSSSGSSRSSGGHHTSSSSRSHGGGGGKF